MVCLLRLKTQFLAGGLLTQRNSQGSDRKTTTGNKKINKNGRTLGLRSDHLFPLTNEESLRRNRTGLGPRSSLAAVVNYLAEWNMGI